MTFWFGDVLARAGGLEPVAGFVLFAVGVAEFAGEVRHVFAFGPGLGNVGADRAGSAAGLVGEGVLLCLGPRLGDLEDFLLEFECQLIDLQFLEARDSSFHI